MPNSNSRQASYNPVMWEGFHSILKIERLSFAWYLNKSYLAILILGQLFNFLLFQGGYLNDD